MMSALSRDRLSVAVGGGLALLSVLFSLVVVPVLGGFTASDLGAEYAVLILGCGVGALFVAFRGDRGSRLRRSDSGMLSAAAAAGGVVLFLLFSRMREARLDPSVYGEAAGEVQEVAEASGLAPSLGLGAWTLLLAVISIAVGAYRCRGSVPVSANRGRPVPQAGHLRAEGNPSVPPSAPRPTEWF